MSPFFFCPAEKKKKIWKDVCVVCHSLCKGSGMSSTVLCKDGTSVTLLLCSNECMIKFFSASPLDQAKLRNERFV